MDQRVRRAVHPVRQRGDLPPPLPGAGQDVEDGSRDRLAGPYWWVDIGATMQNIMLAAVDEGLGCGFAAGRSSRCERTSASRTSSCRSGSCRSRHRRCRFLRPGRRASSAAGSFPVRMDRAGERWRPSPAGSATAAGTPLPVAAGRPGPRPRPRGPQKSRRWPRPPGRARTCSQKSRRSAVRRAAADRQRVASHVSISLNSVQRWNGQPASRQIRTRDRLAKTTSL